MPTFWVYENWQATNKATVHNGNCGHCNDGRGTHGGSSTAHGQWLGPEPTFADAGGRAHATGRPVHICRTCRPHLD